MSFLRTILMGLCLLGTSTSMASVTYTNGGRTIAFQAFPTSPGTTNFFQLPNLTPTPRAGTADQMARQAIQDGTNIINQSQSNLDRTNYILTDLQTSRQNEITARGQLQTRLEELQAASASPAEIAEMENQIRQKTALIEDYDTRINEATGLRDQFQSHRAAGERMAADGRATLARLQNGGGGGGGGGGGSGGGGSGGGGGGGGALAALAGAGLAAGLMAAMMGGKDKDDSMSKYWEDAAKRQEQERIAAAEAEANKVLANDAKAAEDAKNGHPKSGGDILVLLQELNKTAAKNQNGGTQMPHGALVAKAPLLPIPVDQRLDVVGLRVVHCFRMPGRLTVICRPGLPPSYLCVNARNEALPCP